MPASSTPVFGIELMQKQRAALLLIGLSDGFGSAPERFEGTEKSTVRLVLPTHVARTTPPGGPEGVEAAVVPDAGECVRGDILVGQFGQFSPRLEQARVQRRNGL
jgi:hypothetical protein